jgi:hypothetical protein
MSCGVCYLIPSELAGELGFEPRQAESESAVLPLDDSPCRACAAPAGYPASQGDNRRGACLQPPGFDFSDFILASDGASPVRRYQPFANKSVFAGARRPVCAANLVDRSTENALELLYAQYLQVAVHCCLDHPQRSNC